MSADEEPNKRFAVIPEEEDELESRSRVSLSNQDEEHIDGAKLGRKSSVNNDKGSSNVEPARENNNNKSEQDRKETTTRLRSNRIGDSNDSGDSSDQSHHRNQDREILKTWRIPVNSNMIADEVASTSRQEQTIDQADEIVKETVERSGKEPTAWEQSSPPSYKRSISHSKTNNKKDENRKNVDIVDKDEDDDDDYADSEEHHQLASASARDSVVDRKRSSVRATEQVDDDDDNDDDREIVMRDSRNYHTSPKFRSTLSQSNSADQANNNNNNNDAIPDVTIVNMSPQVAKAENERTLEEILERYEIGDELRKKLVLLDDFKIVFILDDSSSMKHLLTESPLLKVQTRVTRWNELQYFANIALQLANFFDPDGCDVYFINKEPGLTNCKNLGELNSLFERTRPKVNRFSLVYLPL